MLVQLSLFGITEHTELSTWGVFILKSFCFGDVKKKEECELLGVEPHLWISSDLCWVKGEREKLDTDFIKDN